MSRVQQLADVASRSPDIERRLGALVLFAGLADFQAIQARRLLEQITLKAQMVQGQNPTFQPHEDIYFYEKRRRTRGIFKEVGKLLPFNALDPSAINQAHEVTRLAQEMVDAGLRFCELRDLIIHRIGHPKISFEDVARKCDCAIAEFSKFQGATHKFFESAAPFRFSEKENSYFYASKARGV